jgi:hypothetical protein
MKVDNSAGKGTSCTNQNKTSTVTCASGGHLGGSLEKDQIKKGATRKELRRRQEKD